MNPVEDLPHLSCPILVEGLEDTNTTVSIDMEDPDGNETVWMRFTLEHGKMQTTSAPLVSTELEYDESVDYFHWQGILTGSPTQIIDKLKNDLLYTPVKDYNKVFCSWTDNILNFCCCFSAML